jgi:hypothetical protein
MEPTPTRKLDSRPNRRRGVETSAWRIGGGREAVSTLSSDGGLGAVLTEYVDKVVKWIPGEIVAFYGAAIVIASSGSASDRGSRSLWIGALVATLILVLLAGLKAKKRFRFDIAKRLLLGGIAFLVWSAAVPRSGWTSWNYFADNARSLAIGAALVGLVFAKAADMVAPDD